MRFIHEQSDWPGFHWDSAKLAELLGEVRHRQGRLLGRMEGLGFDLREKANLENLTEEVVKSSAIEGEILDVAQVRSSIARRLGMALEDEVPTGREVEGVVEMTLDATRNHEFPLTADRLFGWHSSLFPSGRSGMRKIVVGAWRTPDSGAMQVVSGAPGREKVHFEAPAAERLDAEMAAFLNWFETAPPMDPVLKASLAHLWFVTVHPFEDGNGRVARAVSELALCRADGFQNRFYSVSSRIEANRKQYYLQLERTQRGGMDVTAWHEWFLGSLLEALAATDGRLGEVLRKSRVWERANRFPINNRQRIVLNRLLDGFHGHLTTPKYAKLAKCSDDTALRDIQALVDMDVLVKNPGGGRSSSYSVGDF